MPNMSLVWWSNSEQLIGHVRLSYISSNCHFQLVRASADWAIAEEEAWYWWEFDFCCFGFGLVWAQCRNERRGEGCRSYTGTCNIDTIYYLLKRKKKHLHCTLGNRTPIFFLLTINHYQWVVKIKWRFPMAAGKEIHQKCVTGHKETWGKQQKRTKHDRTKHIVGQNSIAVMELSSF